jgi:hypothetical protein
MNQDKLNEKLSDFAKLWLAHDGLWFQAVERKFGIETAIEMDKAAWNKFSPLEAKRIMQRLNLNENGGIETLLKALPERLYATLNQQEVVESNEKRAVFMMKTCRVQDARYRKKMEPFPCKEVGIVEYTEFVKTIDPRIKTRCLHCPPDKYNGEFWCKWEFALE